MEQLRRLTDRYIYFHLDVVGQSAHLQEEHRQILAAVKAQDAVAAADLTREHLASSHAVVLDYLLAHGGRCRPLTWPGGRHRPRSGEAAPRRANSRPISSRPRCCRNSDHSSRRALTGVSQPAPTAPRARRSRSDPTKP